MPLGGTSLARDDGESSSVWPADQPQRRSSAALVVMGYAGAVEVLGPIAALLLGWGFCCVGSPTMGVVGALAVLRGLGSLFVAIAAIQAMRTSARLTHPRRAGLLAVTVIVALEVAWVILFMWVVESQPYIPAGIGLICTLIIGVITHVGFSRMTPTQGGRGFPIEPSGGKTAS